MKGSLKERSPGHWAIILDTRDPCTGKRKRRWHSFQGTKRQAQVEQARLVTEAERGTSLEPSRVTVGEYIERWLEHVQTQVSPSSHKTYGTMLAYMLPTIGHIRLSKLRPDNIAHAYATAMQTGYRRRRGGLSAKSMTLLHRVLSLALKQAVKWNLLKDNPAAAVEPPRVERKEARTLDSDATLALVEAARGAELFPLILLAAMTGMRRGELAALRWQAIDFNAGQLAVTASIEQVGRSTREKPPKSGRPRTIALPALLVEELRRYRVVQAEQLLRLGVRPTEATHVCLRADGSPWLPSLVSAGFVRLLKANGLAHMRLHELRHTHASHLLAANVHPKVVQERLGHANIGMTLDLYSHVVRGMQEQAAASIDDIMQAARRRSVAKR
jgi:integrase